MAVPLSSPSHMVLMTQRRRGMRLLLVILTTSSCSPTPALQARAQGTQAGREVDLSRFFEGIDPDDAAFVLLNGETGDVIRHNPKRAQQRFIPASTYKIPNSLIALETGVASGPDHLIRWDSTAPRGPGFWAPVWSKDHTLGSAIDNSVYWYYQTLARDVGTERMQRYLRQFDYGNRSTGGGIDRFWLHGDLRISPDEQVRFLRRMYDGDLGVSERSTAIVKDIILLEETPEYRLSGKTGTADVTPTRELAWLVGYVEREGAPWFFALNMEGERVWEQWGSRAARLSLVRSLLRELAVIPPEPSAQR